MFLGRDIEQHTVRACINGPLNLGGKICPAVIGILDAGHPRHTLARQMQAQIGFIHRCHRMAAHRGMAIQPVCLPARPISGKQVSEHTVTAQVGLPPNHRNKTRASQRHAQGAGG
jgi:hypothetical protein